MKNKLLLYFFAIFSLFAYTVIAEETDEPTTTEPTSTLWDGTSITTAGDYYIEISDTGATTTVATSATIGDASGTITITADAGTNVQLKGSGQILSNSNVVFDFTNIEAVDKLSLASGQTFTIGDGATLTIKGSSFKVISSSNSNLNIYGALITEDKYQTDLWSTINFAYGGYFQSVGDINIGDATVLNFNLDFADNTNTYAFITCNGFTNIGKLDYGSFNVDITNIVDSYMAIDGWDGEILKFFILSDTAKNSTFNELYEDVLCFTYTDEEGVVEYSTSLIDGLATIVIDGVSYDVASIIETTDTAYNYYISITAAIPEPSTYAMIFGVLALAFAYYRRRK